jgi:hypothetical protein
VPRASALTGIKRTAQARLYYCLGMNGRLAARRIEWTVSSHHLRTAELAAGRAEDFVFELAEVGFVAAVLEFDFDGVHLVLHAADARFDICDIVLRRHVLHDVRDAAGDVADFLAVLGSGPAGQV